MTQSSILMTGASSFIGFACLVQALQNGHQVRCAVRSQSKKDLILSNQLIRSLSPGDRLSFIEIADFTNTTSWDPAVVDMDSVIHLASPKPRDQFRDDSEFVHTAVGMTIAILHAASRSTSIKRVVITSSMVALRSGDRGATVPVSGDSRIPNLDEPYANVALKYVASKVATLNAVDDFIRTENPPFPIVNLMPGWTIGRHALATSEEDLLQSSNRMVLLPLLGKPLPYSGRPISPTVHLQDVANLHLRALGPEITTHRNFTMAAPCRFEDIIAIAQKHFPEAIESRKLPAVPVPPTVVYAVDTTAAEELFNMKFRSFEEQVITIVEQYLEFSG